MSNTEIDHTDIKEFRRLVQDCEAVLTLHDTEIHVAFPVSEEMETALAYHHEAHQYAMIEAEQSPEAAGVRANRIVRATIRSLVNPQFNRVTSFAHHATCFTNGYPPGIKRSDVDPLEPKCLTGYGRITCKKKAGEPFTIMFRSKRLAAKLFKALS